jgi:hypothetical protein
MDNVISYFPFYISTDAVGGSNYIGEVTNGVSNSGAINYETLTFTPDSTHSDTLYYQSATAEYMGYRIILSDGNNSEDLTDLCIGDYNLTVTDANDCSDNYTYSLINAIYGCTDSTMFNYDPSANIDDGSCISFIYGCMDSTACNFDLLANTDDGLCGYTQIFNQYENACDSFYWAVNGNTYFNSTLDTSNYFGVFGCDSTFILDLVINNTTSSTTVDTACDSYTWNGTTYTQTGTYSSNIGSNNNFSMSFDGIDDEVIVTSNTSLSSNFTIQAWWYKAIGSTDNAFLDNWRFLFARWPRVICW